MESDPEFISFHDKLTGQYHTVTWEEAKRAMLSLWSSLGRRPTRDEVLLKALQDKDGN